MNSKSEAPRMEIDPTCCPRCGASDALLPLLTSMTRYFVCRRCDCRWEVSVVTTPTTANNVSLNRGTPPGSASIWPPSPEPRRREGA
jgi:hypothetical protein